MTDTDTAMSMDVDTMIMTMDTTGTSQTMDTNVTTRTVGLIITTREGPTTTSHTISDFGTSWPITSTMVTVMVIMFG